MFQFRIGGVNSNSFYLSSRGEDARYVFDQLVEHTEDDEVACNDVVEQAL